MKHNVGVVAAKLYCNIVILYIPLQKAILIGIYTLSALVGIYAHSQVTCALSLITRVIRDHLRMQETALFTQIARLHKEFMCIMHSCMIDLAIVFQPNYDDDCT